VEFATKPQIARQMIKRAIAAKVPFSFVATDTVYGTGMIEALLRNAGKGYVLGVAANRVFHSWGKPQFVSGTAATIAQSLPKTAWRRLSSGEGTKGPRLHDWAYVELADLEAGTPAGKWTRGLLIRRNIAGGDLAFFSTWCPEGTPMAKLVAVEGHRWAIEDSFETAKNEFGLDHNETRSWHGWHRHVSLVMLAFAMMAVIRHRANAEPALKKHHHAGTPNIAPDPLVDPGNPSHRYQARSTAHLDRPCSRMVALAASSSGRSAPRSPQKKNATVMLRAAKNITSAEKARYSGRKQGVLLRLTARMHRTLRARLSSGVG
jgi:SRSO17 transposase